MKSTPVIVGDTNPSTLATNLHFVYHPLPQIKFESRIQTGAFPYAEDVGDTIGIAEYLGKSSSVSLTVYNPKRNSGRITIGCLHSFNNNFCAGAELLTEWQQCALKYRLALAARYVWCFDFFIVSTTTDCSLFPLNIYYLLFLCAYVCARRAFFDFNSTQITRVRFPILCHEQKFHSIPLQIFVEKELRSCDDFKGCIRYQCLA